MVFQIAWIPLPITITRNEEEFEEEFDDDDFEMIQNIVEDQIQNNSEITAQPIIWREKHWSSWRICDRWRWWRFFKSFDNFPRTERVE